MHASERTFQKDGLNPAGNKEEADAKSVAALYMIREAVRDLYGFLARYSRLSKLQQEDHFLFAIRRVQLLKGELIPLSPEAFMESVQLSVNILSFRECVDEKYAELAKSNPSKICNLLCLDDQNRN